MSPKSTPLSSRKRKKRMAWVQNQLESQFGFRNAFRKSFFLSFGLVARGTARGWPRIVSIFPYLTTRGEICPPVSS